MHEVGLIQVISVADPDLELTGAGGRAVFFFFFCFPAGFSSFHFFSFFTQNKG